MKYNFFIKKNEKKILVKKLVGIGLVTIMVFSWTPLGVHALSNDGEVCNKTKKVIEEMYAGEVFTTGDYVIKNNIKVVQDKPGGNGIEIKGDVRFIFEKNSTVEITAGNAEGTIGGGAGICLSRGNVLTLEGKGELCIKGGCGAKGQPGEPGDPGEAKYFGENLMAKPGDTGRGGAGGGGGGAAIGTPGGNGGQPGAGVKGDWIPAGQGSTCDAQNGTNGDKGERSKQFGLLIIHGDIDLKPKGGEGFRDKAKAGKSGKNFKCYAPYKSYDIIIMVLRVISGGAGGGAGGNGFSGADIGCGGSGGGAGGTGGAGVCADVDYLGRFNGCGGVGGQGIGLGSLDKSGKGGAGGQVFNDKMYINAGNGGDGGLSTSTIESGCVYDARIYESDSPMSQTKSDYDGKESPRKRVIVDSDCIAQIKNAPPGNVYPYTGHPIEPEIIVVDKRTNSEIPKESYRIVYLDNVNVGKAIISVQGVDVGTKDIPMIVCEDDIDICGDVETFFTIE